MRAILDKLFPDIVVPVRTDNSYMQVLLKVFFTIILSGVFYTIKKLSIEPNTGISELGYFIVPAFFISSFTPVRFKPFVYVALFLSCVYYAFGSFSGSVLLLLLLLPYLVIQSQINWNLKVFLVIAFSLVLLLLRLDMAYFPRVNLVIPFAASILMFRVILLLYEVKYAPLSNNFWLNISYLFSFPSLSFLFAPIIDYRAFIKSYSAVSYEKMFHRSLWYITIGIAQLLLYKLCYTYLSISATSINDILSLLIFLTAKYSTVFKATGIITLSVGFITAFGFNLPAPFGNFLLAHNFSDYWRKVNVYWRDFVIKIVYYPIYFAIRKKTRYVFWVSIFSAFILSWFFHGYQRFWISGVFTNSINDILFWLILGLLVAFTTKQGGEAQKLPDEHQREFVSIFRQAIGIVIVTIVMLFLWFMWQSNNLTDFFFIIKKGLVFNNEKLILLLILLIGFIFLYTAGVYLTSIKVVQNVRWKLLTTYSLLGLFFFLIMNPVFSENQLVATLINPIKLSQDDLAEAEGGYYESVMNANSNWELSMKKPRRFDALDKVTTRTNDLLMFEFLPNADVVINNYNIKTNALGFRDKQYSIDKPQNTTRIVLLGTSYELGAGVNNEDVFESIAEERLNKQDTINKVEILNLSMGGYTAVQEMELMKTKVAKLKPDVVMVFAHTDEIRRFTSFFSRYIKNGVDLKYDYLKEVKRKSGVRQSMSEMEIKERLAPYMQAVFNWCYAEIARQCIASGIKPICVFFPTTRDTLTPEKIDEVKLPAQQAGFTVYVLQHAFDKKGNREIGVSVTDHHPNKYGHFLLAEAFYNLLSDSNNHLLNK